jgi:hypothetical protein
LTRIDKNHDLGRIGEEMYDANALMMERRQYARERGQKGPSSSAAQADPSASIAHPDRDIVRSDNILQPLDIRAINDDKTSGSVDFDGLQ